MAGPDVERRRVRALSARTHFIPGYGQVHFDPDSANEDVSSPLMPVSEIDILVSNGWIADDYSPLDHDDDGEAGGSKAQTGGDVAALRAEYKAKTGRNPFAGWNADVLRERIAAAPVKNDDGKAGGDTEDAAP